MNKKVIKETYNIAKKQTDQTKLLAKLILRFELILIFYN